MIAHTAAKVWAGNESKYMDWRVLVCVVCQWPDGTKLLIGNDHTRDGQVTHKIRNTKTGRLNHFASCIFARHALLQRPLPIRTVFLQSSLAITTLTRS